jgi:uncharacterized membrane protein YgdD (TMEM256/DUF423 family)
MGILTDNTALNAWIVLGLMAATAIGLGATGFAGLKAYQFLAGLGIPQTGVKLIYYFPVALLAFGVIADIISQTFKFSIGSLVGVISMIANGLVGMGVPKGTPTTIAAAVTEAASTVAAAPAAVAEVVSQAVAPAADAWETARTFPPKLLTPAMLRAQTPFTGGGSEFCSFPGLENFDNKWAPQNILVVTAVMFYYMIGEWESGNANRTVAPGLTLLVTVLAQFGTMYSSGCLDPIWSPAVAIVAGAVFGISGYHITKAINGSSTPFIANQTTKTAGGFSGVEAPTDATKPADGSKCAQANDDDQFVCDLYKNGELVTTTVSG